MRAKAKSQNRHKKLKIIKHSVIYDSGALKAKIEWNKIQKIKETRQIYIQVRDKNNVLLYDADGDNNEATVALVFTPTVTKMAENKSMVKVAGSPPITGGTCVCKQDDLIWGNMVSCEFRKKVVEICKELWGEKRKIEMANGLMAVMNVETGGSFKAHQIMGKPLKDVNKITKDDFWLEKKDGTKTSRAIGLIQFTQSAIIQVGEFEKGAGLDKLHEVKLKFAKMGEIKQLDFVKKYFADSKDKIKSSDDIYLHVFAPKGVGKSDDYILYESGTEEYRQNKSIDEENNNDGKIQRSEILGRYKKSVKDGNSNKEGKFSCGINQIKNDGKLLFPFHKTPLNHPDGFKNKDYNGYDYTLNESNAATFGYKRPDNRIHGARDLYYEVDELIYAIDGGTVKQVSAFYYDTWVIEIEHDYEHVKGKKIMVRYGEVNKDGILVKVGQRVEKGDKIAKIGLLFPYIRQPYPDKRGMLHFEIYTGEETGSLTNKKVKYEDMTYAKSTNYNKGRSFQRRKDLIDPLPLLKNMYENSKKEGLIK